MNGTILILALAFLSASCSRDRNPPHGGAVGTPKADAQADLDSGGWCDPSSGLCWQDPVDGAERTWSDAMAYCSGLSLGGYGPGSWHLPTISELRSLIRGCPASVTGGTCGVTDSCPGDGCWRRAECGGCDEYGGSGVGRNISGQRTTGCYWTEGLDGKCGFYWSSSSYGGGVSDAWFVSFNTGFIFELRSDATSLVRCVRPGP